MWDSRMVTEWENIANDFVTTLQSIIGRKRSNNSHFTLEQNQCRQPLQMPKLYSLTTHCTQFAYNYGYLGAFSEQVFEHHQQVSGKKE